jgi:hypothetical protein
MPIQAAFILAHTQGIGNSKPGAGKIIVARTTAVGFGLCNMPESR